MNTSTHLGFVVIAFSVGFVDVFTSSTLLSCLLSFRFFLLNNFICLLALLFVLSVAKLSTLNYILSTLKESALMKKKFAGQF